MTEIPEELRDFAELMVDEVLARLRVKIENGGWSIEEQREIIAACIAEQDVKRTLRADNAALREGLAVSCEKMETSLAAMDKYNEANGTYIIGPSLLSLGKQIATNRALLEKKP